MAALGYAAAPLNQCRMIFINRLANGADYTHACNKNPVQAVFSCLFGAVLLYVIGHGIHVGKRLAAFFRVLNGDTVLAFKQYNKF